MRISLVWIKYCIQSHYFIPVLTNCSSRILVCSVMCVTIVWTNPYNRSMRICIFRHSLILALKISLIEINIFFSNVMHLASCITRLNKLIQSNIDKLCNTHYFSLDKILYSESFLYPRLNKLLQSHIDMLCNMCCHSLDKTFKQEHVHMHMSPFPYTSIEFPRA